MRYFCDSCGKTYNDDEVNIRTENNVFTAPFGDDFVNGGGVFQIETCPGCGDDLEEVEE